MSETAEVITFDNAATMGLSRVEWDLIEKRLGRTPVFVSWVFFRRCGLNIAHTNHPRNG